MYKKTMTYTDFDGNERTEDFYFNLTKAELAEMECSVYGGLDNLLEKIVNEKDPKKLVEYFKFMILKAYGVKSEDGRRFMKSQEIRDSFEQTEAYSDLFIELASNTDAASEFANGIMPNSLKNTNPPASSPIPIPQH